MCQKEEEKKREREMTLCPNRCHCNRDEWDEISVKYQKLWVSKTEQYQKK